MKRPVDELIFDLVPKLVPLGKLWSEFVCLDFRHDPDLPAVIELDMDRPNNVRSEIKSVSTGFANYLAPSLTEWLKLCFEAQGEDHEGPDRSTLPPYRFGQELIDWEASFDDYMSQWGVFHSRYED